MKSYLIILGKFSITFIILIIFQLVFFDLLLSNYVNLHIPKDKTILILGDSCPETDLNDSLIDNSINLSQGADALFFTFFKLKSIHKKNDHIETVILGFSPDNAYSRIFYDIPVTKSRFGNYFYLINFSDYPELILYNFEGLIRGIVGLGKYFIKAVIIIKQNDIRKIGLGGFAPRPTNINELEDSIKSKGINTENSLSSIEIKYFERITDYCNTNNLNLIILNPPVHQSLLVKRKKKKKSYYKVVTTNRNKPIFWDLEDCKYEDKYFYDNKHLNNNGAEIFSKMINEKLKKK